MVGDSVCALGVDGGGVLSLADGWALSFRLPWRSARDAGQVFQGNPGAQERYHHVSLDSGFLMKRRSISSLLRAKGGFGLSQLHILRPNSSASRLQIGAQQVAPSRDSRHFWWPALICQNKRPFGGVARATS